MKYTLISEEKLHSLVLLAELAEYRSKMKFTITQALKDLKTVDLSDTSQKGRVHAVEVEKYFSPTKEAYKLRAKNSYQHGISDLIEEFT